MNFSEQTADKYAPGATVVLPEWAFAESWADRPVGGLCVGLRRISDADNTKARAAAETAADEMHDDNRSPAWTDCYNDNLVWQLCALGMCDPNDYRRCHPLFPMAEDQVPRAMTARGARFLFERLQRYEVEASPIEPELQDEEIEAFCLTLADFSHRLLPGHRKMLAAVYDAINET